MRKITALMLSVILVVMMIPIQVFAADSEPASENNVEDAEFTDGSGTSEVDMQDNDARLRHRPPAVPDDEEEQEEQEENNDPDPDPALDQNQNQNSDPDTNPDPDQNQDPDPNQETDPDQGEGDEFEEDPIPYRHAYGLRTKYINLNPNGSYERVEWNEENGVLIVEERNSEFNVVDYSYVVKELDYFGGYFTDGTYNYVVYGRDNPEAQSYREVIRVVKYSKAWRRLSACKIKTTNDDDPVQIKAQSVFTFETDGERFGSCNIVKVGSYLYISTNYTSYPSETGHTDVMPLNLVIELGEDNEMIWKRDGSRGILPYVAYPNPTHQLLIADDDTLVEAESGITLPSFAGALLLPYQNNATTGYWVSTESPVYTPPILGEYPGVINPKNYVNIYSMVATPETYLIIGTDMQEHSSKQGVYVWVYDKETKTVRSRILLSKQSDFVDCDQAYLVKMDDDNIIAVWNSRLDNGVMYCRINRNGERQSRYYLAPGRDLTSCEPIVVDDHLIWYKGSGDLDYEPDSGNPVDPPDDTDPTVPVEPPKPYQNPFTDVKDTSYYADAVRWAVENGVTAGTSADHFSPSEACTRSQIVTFLWRAAGSPEPENSNIAFTDVKNSAYYAKAVAWAVENNITNGTSNTHFSPNAKCTRAQIVTFLWRYAGSPDTTFKNPFEDIDPTAYYYRAVAWAVKNEVTAGVSTVRFGPNENCTRSQAVTFLWRYSQLPKAKSKARAGATLK